MRNQFIKIYKGVIRFFQPSIDKRKPTTTSVLQQTDNKLLTYDRTFIDVLTNDPVILRRIAITLELDDGKINEYILPILTYVAERTLHLPASQWHHHTYPGGLYQHLMEVGITAAHYAKHDKEMRINARFEHDNLYTIVVPLAAFIAGILHDIAKPITDYHVYPYDANKNAIEVDGCWDPMEESVIEYLERHKAVYYKPLYKMNREYRTHEKYASSFMKPILDLLQTYPHRPLLREIVMWRDDKNKPLLRHISQADQNSVGKDLDRKGQPLIYMDLSSYFLNLLVDFDYTNRFLRDDHIYLQTYCVSEEAVHIFYPHGLNNLIKSRVNLAQYINERDFSLPTKTIQWVQDLGKRRVLIPDYSVTGSHEPNPDYPEASKFINQILIHFDDDRDPMLVNAISISRMHITFQELHQDELVTVTRPNAEPKAPILVEDNTQAVTKSGQKEIYKSETPVEQPVESTSPEQDTPAVEQADSSADVQPTQAAKTDEEHPTPEPYQSTMAIQDDLPEESDEPDEQAVLTEPQCISEPIVPSSTSAVEDFNSLFAVPKEQESPPERTAQKNDALAALLDPTITKPNIDALSAFKVSEESCLTPNTDTHLSQIYNQHKIEKLHNLMQSSEVIDLIEIRLWLTVIAKTLASMTEPETITFKIHEKSSDLMVFEKRLKQDHFHSLANLYLPELAEDDLLSMSKVIDKELKAKHVRTELFLQKKEAGYTRFKKPYSQVLLAQLSQPVLDAMTNKGVE